MATRPIAAPAPSAHRLGPLLEPRSIAYLGASEKVGSPGNGIVRCAVMGGYAGEVFPVNPKYQSIEGFACYPSLAELPHPPDMVVLAVADRRLEAALAEAIEARARSAVIFGGANLIEPEPPRLPERLGAMAREAGIPICGGNCMGFYNLDHGLLATFFPPPYLARRGGITLISHSGSSWSVLTLNDTRLAYNLAVSSGQEVAVSAAEYLDYAVEQASTEVVGLLLETVREPEAFLAALAKANERQVPVVVLKVGRTARSAQLAISHSGAIAGHDAAYEAVFDRYGVTRVETLQELGACLALHSCVRKVGEGALAASLDSGFERELVIDLAEDERVPLAAIDSRTTARLAELLDPGLAPINPLDVWGTGHDYQRVFAETFGVLLEDPAVALGFVCHNVRDNSWVTRAWIDTCLEGLRRSGKPVAVVSGFPWTRQDQSIAELVEAGVPLIWGMENGLVAARSAFEQRDFRARPPMEALAPVADSIRERWAERLGARETLGEAEALALLRDYGIAVSESRTVESAEAAVEAARAIGGRVVVKTAAPDIHHKTEVDGIRVALEGDERVAAAYEDLAARLGVPVSVSRMIEGGVEMSLGILRDPQFGPLVMVGAGGVLIELLRDRRLALPPFDARWGRRMIEGLSSKELLAGHRGKRAVDVEALAVAASRLSLLATDLGSRIAELDVNPIIVTPDGAIAVDALVRPLEVLAL